MNYLTIKKIVKIFLITIFGFCIMALSVPIIVPIFGMFWLVSHIMYCFLKLKYGKTVQKPDGMDIVNGKETEVSKPYMNIVGRFTRKNAVVENIRERFQRIVINQKKENGEQTYKKFTQIFTQVNGYYLWKDAEEFDLANHIRMIDPREILDRQREEDIIDLKLRGKEAEVNKLYKDYNENENVELVHMKWETILKHFMGLYGNRSVKEGCPKWEILCLPETENRFTCLFRVHHSITDGIYFIRMIAEVMADSPVEVRLPYNYRRPNFIIRALLNLWSFSLLPYGLFRVVRTNDRNPLHGLKLTGEKKYFMSEPIDLELLRDIKKETKVTINDIIFSCVSHATAIHFGIRKEAINRMTVLLAVNLQEQNQPLRLKNDFAVTCLQIPTSSAENHYHTALKQPKLILMKDLDKKNLCKFPGLTRLQIVKNSLEDAKNDPSLTAVCWLLTSFSSLLPAFVAEAILSTRGITMDISNVQGPQNNDLVIDDAAAVDVGFCLPDRDPLGIAVSVASYNGYLRVGLAVDSALMPLDQEGTDFLHNFREEIYNLHKEVNFIKRMPSMDKGEAELLALHNNMYKNIP